MKEGLKAYINATNQRNSLVQILSLTTEKKVIETLNTNELNSFTAHLNQVLSTYDEFERNGEPAKAKLYLISLYMGTLVEDYIATRGEK